MGPSTSVPSGDRGWMEGNLGPGRDGVRKVLMLGKIGVLCSWASVVFLLWVPRKAEVSIDQKANLDRLFLGYSACQ